MAVGNRVSLLSDKECCLAPQKFPYFGFLYFGFILYRYSVYSGIRGALQRGRSQVPFPMVALEFFIHIILPAALWPWESTQSLR